MSKLIKSKQKGVVLIEIIVVLTVLIFIIGTALSIFLSMMQNQDRALKEQELFNQTSYAIEYMSKLISGAVKETSGKCLGSRYKEYDYLLTHYDSLNGFYQGIKFIAKDNTCREFFLDEVGSLKESNNSNDSQNILSDKFEVKYARFVIDGDKNLNSSSKKSSTQPRVTFVLNVKIKGLENHQEKIVQTTVSQRDLNVK